MTFINQHIQLSKDENIRKALLVLGDGSKIETVLIKHHFHYTVCLSSQAGCSLACVFCATGQSGFVRNLTVEEMTGQISLWNSLLSKDKEGVKNVVFMGMGEPFLNWDNLKQALRIINAKDGFNIGQRKITVSTCGIVEKIEEFIKENTQINLAISLHSAVDQTRSFLMPVNKKYPLSELIKACLNYVEQTKRKLFFEYTLFQGINDTDDEIWVLIKLIQKHYLFHLNIIPYNVTGCDLKPSDKKRQKAIVNWLRKSKVSFTVRKSFGSDIHAACGQLRTKVAVKNTKTIIGVKMKIMICGSMHFAREMLAAQEILEGLGYTVLIPCDTHECLENPHLNMDIEHCMNTEIDKSCFNKVAESDAIVVLNYPKNGINGYVGGATLMEIGLARHLDKKIFLLYDLPSEEELRYALEIKLTKPVILDGELGNIVNSF